jgi:hypothetical protein
MGHEQTSVSKVKIVCNVINILTIHGPFYILVYALQMCFIESLWFSLIFLCILFCDRKSPTFSLPGLFRNQRLVTLAQFHFDVRYVSSCLSLYYRNTWVTFILKFIYLSHPWPSPAIYQPMWWSCTSTRQYAAGTRIGSQSRYEYWQGE